MEWNGFNNFLLRNSMYFPLGYDGLPEFRDCIDSLPIADESEIFGIHNTNIAFQITYGGRVTDAWDQLCLTTILGRFFLPAIL
ncbi:dynein axonemal heavy chain 6-like [Montipora capricornis]|uniref:dynein axonemal heavy chain 6-like n=1 Tax=Montipora capricornis TaxID=246305 RepID=UPI0035F15ED6